MMIDASFGQIRTAILENQELVEIYIEGQEGQSIVGNVYKGKVENVLPGMQAAFVDIGVERNAFLYIKDILKDSLDIEDEFFERSCNCNICDLIKPGEDILVQVVKDPIDCKGARITTHVTLPGRYAVLLPTVDYIGVSRRITDEVEKERLRDIAALSKPDNMGIIVRTAGELCNVSDLKSDMFFLTNLWESILNKSEEVQAPSLLYKDISLFERILRDIFTVEIEKLIINEKRYFNKAIEITNSNAPYLTERIEYFNKSNDIFNYYNIEEKISKLLNKKVWLKCGGYIVIEQMEALTAIDVNTGKYIGGKDLQDTVLKTNIEAAREIARQLRLRDIGGIIIIDFIDMEDENHKKMVIEVIESALKKDRSKSCVWGMTHLGLLEVTRKKVVVPKEVMMLSPCPCCDGTGRILSPQTMIKLIEKDLKKIISERNIKGVKIEIHPEIEGVLSKYAKYFDTIGLKNNIKIDIETNKLLFKDQYKIVSS